MNRFDRIHHELDCTVVGFYGIEIGTRYLRQDDGAVIVCASPDPNIHTMYEWEPAFYGDVVESLSQEGITHSLDKEATGIFFNCLTKDLRFRPEVLVYAEEDCLLITSAFDPFSDEIYHLKREMDDFVLGYFSRVQENDGKTVIWKAAGDPSNSLTYADCKRLGLEPDELDEFVRGRLHSVEDWDVFVKLSEQ